MTLDPMPDAATLLRMKAEREGRGISSTLSTPRAIISQPESIRYSRMPNDHAVSLRLPWSCLVSDNDKWVAFLRVGKPAMKITREYAAAKGRIAGYAQDVMGDSPPFDQPLSLLARVWFPSGRKNDVSNWCKLVHDALSGIVYTDDRWLHDVRWIRSGVDVDAPHASITITPLSTSPEAA